MGHLTPSRTSPFLAALLLLLLQLGTGCYAQFPLPASIVKGTHPVRLASNFNFSLSSSTVANPTLTFVLKTITEGPLAWAKLSQPATTGATTIASAVIDVSSADESLVLLQTDESYTLTVTYSSANANAAAQIKANNVFGAMRGLQTFCQLAMAGLTDVTVSDAPRFKWRGFMLDTGRHYIDIPTLMGVIRLAAWARLNVFHWHLTDAQSTPITSTSRPAVIDGAFSVNEVYTEDQSLRIKEWARLHGITVVTEVDMPGHSHAWGRGYPGALPVGFSQDEYCDWQTCSSRGIDCRVGVSPAANVTYALLTDVLRERLAGDVAFHMGVDEVEEGCWWHDNAILAMKDASAKGSMEDGPLWTFLNKYKKIVNDIGVKHLVVWDDAFQVFPSSGDDGSDNELPKDLIVQVWGGFGHETAPKPLIINALQKGYRVIASPSNTWYFSGGGNPGWSRYWTEEPSCNGQTCVSDTKQLSQLLGGEGCLWETAQEEVWWGMFWNAFLIGERLWAPQATTDVDDAKQRFAVGVQGFVEGFYNATLQPGLLPDIDQVPLPASNNTTPGTGGGGSSSTSPKQADGASATLVCLLACFVALAAI